MRINFNDFKKSLLLLLWSALFMPINIHAQSRNEIHGQVLDLDTSKPIAGVTVQQKKSSAKTFTNANGRFNLPDNQIGNVLIFSYVGYKTKEVEIKGVNNPLKVLLEKRFNDLEEVVVSTGYQTIPHERATGSFSIVDSSLFNRRVGGNVIDRLEDVTTGLSFDRRSGEAFIEVRGRNTILGNAAPLIVLDNFPYDGDINSINPNDIESVNVLKDAAAASIWGVRASNGVIVINTKKGKYNRPVKTEFNSNITIGEMPDLNSLQWMSSGDFIDAERFLFEQGYYLASEKSSSHPVLSPAVESLVANRDGLLSDDELNSRLGQLATLDVRNDFSKYLYRTNVQQQYALNLSGGSERQTYYFSTGYDADRKNIVGDFNSRLTLRSENSFRVLKKLQLNAGLLFSLTNNANNGLPYTAVTSGTNRPVYPYASLSDDSGNPLAVVRDYRMGFVEDAAADGLLDWHYRPLDELANNDNRSKTADLRVTAGGTYALLDFLTLQGNMQYQRIQTNTENNWNERSYINRDFVNRYTQFNPDGSLDYPIQKGDILNLSQGRINSLSFRGQVNVNKFWSAHHLTALAGMEVREQHNRGDASRLYGYNSNILTYQQQVDYKTPFLTYPSNRLLNIPAIGGVTDRYDAAKSYFANAAYTYSDKYALSGSARLDQSNLFGVKANQKGTVLWSAGLAWTLSEEPFYKLDFLPYLKLRATYGYNGNVDKSLTAYTTARYVSSSTVSGLPYATIVNPPNPELRWERVGVLNLAADFSLKNDRLTGTVEYYRKNGTDLIGDSPLDVTTGFASYRGNTANMKGEGVDVQLNARLLKRALGWNVNFLFSYTSDKVTKYLRPETSAVSFLNDGSLNRNSNASISPLEGRPVYGIYSYAWAGLDGQTGDPMGLLPDGEISNDYASLSRSLTPEDLVYHGTARPKYFGSLRNSFSYHQFEVSFNISYRLDYFFKRASIHYYNLATSWIGHPDYALRWQQPGDEAFTQVPSMVYPLSSARDNFYNNSEVLVESGSHIRLQDIRLNYRLDRSAIKRLPFNFIDFYVYANNLGILWRANKSGIDPESPQMAIPKTFSFGLKFNY